MFHNSMSYIPHALTQTKQESIRLSLIITSNSKLNSYVNINCI